MHAVNHANTRLRACVVSAHTFLLFLPGSPDLSFYFALSFFNTLAILLSPIPLSNPYVCSRYPQQNNHRLRGPALRGFHFGRKVRVAAQRQLIQKAEQKAFTPLRKRYTSTLHFPLKRTVWGKRSRPPPTPPHAQQHCACNRLAFKSAEPAFI